MNQPLLVLPIQSSDMKQSSVYLVQWGRTLTDECRFSLSQPADKSHSVGSSWRSEERFAGWSEVLAAVALYRVTADKRLRHTPLMSFIWLQPRLARRQILCLPLVHGPNSPYLPPGSCGLEPNSSSTCQSQGYQPVGWERPGLAGVFPTGVVEKHIPNCTYLSAPLVFSCS